MMQPQTAIHQVRRVGVISHQSAARQSQDEVTDLGTPETRRRLQADNCMVMYHKDQLDQMQYDATCLIRAAYLLIVNGMDAKAATYGERLGHGADDYETVWAVTVQRNYLDWIDAMAERAAANARAKRGGNRWRTWLPMAVIVDGITCSDIAHQRGMKTQTVAEYLRDALDLFNDVRFGKLRREEKRAA